MDLKDKEVLHLFAGGGGMPCGMEMAGWHSLAAVEVDAIRCQTLRLNFPHMKVIQQPIQEVVLSTYPKGYIPVHTYTWPCKHYTLSANVHGHWTGDSLYLEALREAVLMWPELILIENVLGMRQFPRVMETWRRLPHYYTTEFTLYGEDFSLQRKARVFLMLHRQSYTFPPLERYAQPPLGKQLRDYLDKEAVAEVPPYVFSRLNGAYRDHPIIYDPEQEEPVNLFTNYKRDRSTFLVRDERYPEGVRPFTVSEVARLHGFPEHYRFCGNLGARYGQIIDAVMPTMAYALGRAALDYFAAIEELAPQPTHQGYRQVLSSRPTRTSKHTGSSCARLPANEPEQDAPGQLPLWA